MFSRKLIYVPLLAAAFGVPFSMSESGRASFSKLFSPKNSEQAEEDNSELDINAIVNNDENPIALKNARQKKYELIDTESISYSPPLGDFRNVFRFNATPGWIRDTWPRVSVTSFDNLTGYRVPFVSGPAREDIVGSLTYYLDNRNTVQRVEFDGYTFDPNRILQHVVHVHGLTPDLYFGSNLYSRRTAKNYIVSVVQIDQPTAIYANKRKGGQVHIRLELNNPQGWDRLSNAMKQRLSILMQRNQRQVSL